MPGRIHGCILSVVVGDFGFGLKLQLIAPVDVGAYVIFRFPGQTPGATGCKAVSKIVAGRAITSGRFSLVANCRWCQSPVGKRMALEK
jgi:hypothetical protein